MLQAQDYVACASHLQTQGRCCEFGHDLLGGNFGLLVIKDTFRNKILWYKFVRYERIANYLKGFEWLR